MIATHSMFIKSPLAPHCILGKTRRAENTAGESTHPSKEGIVCRIHYRNPVLYGPQPPSRESTTSSPPPAAHR